MASVEYYRKVRDLVTTIQDSERHRLELEKQLNGYLKSTKRLERLQARRLLDYWRRLRDDELRMHSRNEQTLRRIEEADAHSAVLAARTESLRLAKAQYEDSISRLYPGWRAIVDKRIQEERQRDFEREESYNLIKKQLLQARQHPQPTAAAQGRPPREELAHPGDREKFHGAGQQTFFPQELLAAAPPYASQTWRLDVLDPWKERSSTGNGSGHLHSENSRSRGTVGQRDLPTVAQPNGLLDVTQPRDVRKGGRPYDMPNIDQPRHELNVTQPRDELGYSHGLTVTLQEVSDSTFTFGQKTSLPAAPLQPVSYQEEAFDKVSRAQQGLGRAAGSDTSANERAAESHDERSTHGIAGCGPFDSRSPPNSSARAAHVATDPATASVKAAVSSQETAVHEKPLPHGGHVVRGGDAMPSKPVAVGSELHSVSWLANSASPAVVESGRQRQQYGRRLQDHDAFAASADESSPGKLSSAYLPEDDDEAKSLSAPITDPWSDDDTISASHDRKALRSAPTAQKPQAVASGDDDSSDSGQSKKGDSAGRDVSLSNGREESRREAAGCPAAVTLSHGVLSLSESTGDVSRTDPTRGGADGESAGGAAGGTWVVRSATKNLEGAPADADDGDRLGSNELSNSAAQKSTLSEQSQCDVDGGGEGESLASITATAAYQNLLKGSLTTMRPDSMTPARAGSNDGDTSSEDSVEAVERQMKSVYEKGALMAAPSLDDGDVPVNNEKSGSSDEEDEDDAIGHVSRMGYSSAATVLKGSLPLSTLPRTRAETLPTSPMAAASTGGSSAGAAATAPSPRYSTDIRSAAFRTGSDIESDGDEPERGGVSSQLMKNSTPTLDDDDFDFYG